MSYPYQEDWVHISEYDEKVQQLKDTEQFIVDENAHTLAYLLSARDYMTAGNYAKALDTINLLISASYMTEEMEKAIKIVEDMKK